MKQACQKGHVRHRESFLNTVSEKLGENRARKVARPRWSYQPQWNILKDATKDDLLTVLEKQCEEIHTECIRTTKDNLQHVLTNTLATYNGNRVITWNDERFRELGIEDYLEQLNDDEMKYRKWDETNREANIQFATHADVGITFSDITLAESGTVVLFNDSKKGRSVSLLPKTHLVLIPKSTLVPRFTQATKIIRNQIHQGETVASCINFISGPSNSADIEMDLVVGVHGPLYAVYIVIEDW